ncbi:IclR family transcriptional regulator [Limnochorda pilosa]|uniref:IclR family transcriptional regulator n=1 Tax=Limnochorda pilosa TaxID=1555112 RepID=UPI00130E3714|nr:IclR family transcriptional regulator [Limnochorda pilosa]
MERALELLVHLAQARGGLAVTEAHQVTGLHKATAHRLLTTLERCGFAVQDPATRRYRPGYRVLELAAGFLRDSELVEVALPEMRYVRDKTRETVTLYVREGADRICIQRVESPQSVRQVVSIGERYPLTRGAAGKVLLAFTADEERQRVLQEYMARRTQQAPVHGWEAFIGELDEVRHLSWAISHGERDPQVTAIAAPILSADGEALAALSVSGPATRLAVADTAAIAREVVEVSNHIARRLAMINP